MAWAQEIPGSGQWRGLYRDAAGRQRTATGGPFRTEALARREAAVAEDDARRRPGRPGPRAGRLTWSGWADEWWARRRVEPGTLGRDASRRARHLEPYWATTRLDAITRETVQEWIDELHQESGLGSGTIRNCYYLFSGSLRAAVTAGRMPANPCIAIELPAQPIPDARYLSWDEVAAIAHFLKPSDALLVWWLAGTGMRWGEAVGIHRHRLELEQARVDVHEVWDSRMGEVKPYPKGRRRRSVPLPAWLKEMVTEHLPDGPRRATCGEPHRSGSRCLSGLVLPGRDGKVTAYPAFRRSRWADAVARAGLANVRIHDLRHTYASWLIQDGVSIEALSDLLGHGSVATTMRYAHLADTQWSAVRFALDQRAAAAKLATHLPHERDSIPHLRSS